MLDAMKEEAVGFLFNVTVEAVPATPAAQVAPVAAPTGLAEFAAAGRGEGAARAASRPRSVSSRPGVARQGN